MIEEILIQTIRFGGLAMGGLAFGVCLGFGMWLSGVKTTVAIVERVKPKEVKDKAMELEN